MIRVGIVAALAAEARAISRRIANRGIPFTLNDGTLLAVSGIGATAATAAALALIDSGAQALVSFGLAGGLDPSLAAGAIFLPAEIISSHTAAFRSSQDWRERLGGALAAHQPLMSGKLLSSTKAITAVGDKAAAFAQTGAAAVDMESFAVAQIAAQYGLPFLTARVIVDTANDALPPAVMSASASGGLHIGRMIGALARSPGDIIGILRLARRYRLASRSLRTIADTGLLQDAAAR